MKYCQAKPGELDWAFVIMDQSEKELIYLEDKSVEAKFLIPFPPHCETECRASLMAPSGRKYTFVNVSEKAEWPLSGEGGV